MGWLTERWKYSIGRALAYVGGGYWLDSNPNMQPFILSLVAGAALADSVTWLFRVVGMLPLHLKEDIVDIAVMTAVVVRFSDQVETLKGLHGAELGGGFMGFMTVFLVKVVLYSTKAVMPPR